MEWEATSLSLVSATPWGPEFRCVAAICWKKVATKASIAVTWLLLIVRLTKTNIFTLYNVFHFVLQRHMSTRQTIKIIIAVSTVHFPDVRIVADVFFCGAYLFARFDAIKPLGNCDLQNIDKVVRLKAGLTWNDRGAHNKTGSYWKSNKDQQLTTKCKRL